MENRHTPQEEVIEQVRMDVMEVVASHMVEHDYQRTTRANVYYAPEAKAMVVNLRQWLWGETLDEKGIIYPTTWWDAFKGRWFPRWALDRWPPHMTRHTWKVRREWLDIEAVPGEEKTTIRSYLDGVPARAKGWKESDCILQQEYKTIRYAIEAAMGRDMMPDPEEFLNRFLEIASRLNWRKI